MNKFKALTAAAGFLISANAGAAEVTLSWDYPQKSKVPVASFIAWCGPNAQTLEAIGDAPASTRSLQFTLPDDQLTLCGLTARTSAGIDSDLSELVTIDLRKPATPTNLQISIQIQVQVNAQ